MLNNMLIKTKQNYWLCRRIFQYSATTLTNKHEFHTQTILSQTQPEIFTQLQEISKTGEYKKIKPPEYFNFSGDIIDSWANADKKEDDQHLAFWFVHSNGKEEKWTYEELSKKSKKAANALTELGGGSKWKRCFVILPKAPEWWLITAACARIGCVMISSVAMLSPKDIQYRLHSSKAECIITSPHLAEAVDNIASTCPVLTTKILIDRENKSRKGWLNYEESYQNASDKHQCARTKSSDVFQIYFTSGTTGLPKRVVHTHGGLPLAFFIFAKIVLKLDRNVVMWNYAEPGWIKTLWTSLLSPWMSGATAFAHEAPQFDPKLILEVLKSYPIQRLCAPPTVYRMLMTLDVPKFKHLEYCYAGGESLGAEYNKEWLGRTGLTIHEGIGQTETPPLIGNEPTVPVKLGSIGKASEFLADVAILDDDGKEVPVGTTGQLAVRVKPNRPLGLFTEYEDEPDKTATVFVGDYYLTGDRVSVDEDGYYWYECRTDDVIISSAYRIGPFEVESVLQEHPDVLETGVIGVPDPTRTQIVKAFIVLKEKGKKKDPTVLKKELQEYVKSVTAPYKYPREIEFVDSLPKTISLKVKRSELRAIEAAKAKNQRTNTV